MDESRRDKSGEKEMRFKKLVGWGIALACMCLSFTAGTRYRYRSTLNIRPRKDMQALLARYFDGLGIPPEAMSLWIEKDGLCWLDLHDSAISDLSVLEGIPLVELDIAATKVSDLAPLAKFTTLRSLNVSETEVSDLSPLSKLPLDILNISHTNIRDLSPITNMSLRVLWIMQTAVTNADVIFQTDIDYLMFSSELFSEAQLDKLRISKIRTINGYDSTRFWEWFDNRRVKRPAS